MIKRTLYFGNPSKLSVEFSQLKISLKSREGKPKISMVPIEDIGVLVLDNSQITITHAVFEKLLDNNAAIITCNAKHNPTGLLLNLDGNSVQTERFSSQIKATAPMKKQLWKQTIQQKIINQASVINQYTDKNTDNMLYWARSVKSGDTLNHEARAAAYYWKILFEVTDFKRDRYGLFPNNYLNYGYAILRAVVSRALVSSGLLPSIGIHHRNRYNSFCLSDDIMEPYRPFVDKHILNIMEKHPREEEITPTIKAELLKIPVLDMIISNQQSPLMVGVSQTTASLNKCFEGTQRKLVYPYFSNNRCLII